MLWASAGSRRLAPATILATGATAVLAALVLFAVHRGQLWLAFTVRGVPGLGVGVLSAAMPNAILAILASPAASR